MESKIHMSFSLKRSYQKWSVVISRFLRDVLIEFFFGIYYRFFSSIKHKPLPPVTSDILLQSATQLADNIRRGKLKSRQVIEAYIQRINLVNPLMNAVVADRFEAARQEADEVDNIISKYGTEGLEDGEYSLERKPLLGVPLSVKECIAVKGMPNTSGSLYRKGITADQDAPAVKRLRDAGAIPLTVTNVSEICMFWESNNKVYGLTKNPYDQTRVAGGSSGGEGALTAAAGSVIGVGTDIGGSVRLPSFMNGVFGHKPTPGFIPVAGQFPGGEDNLTKTNTIGPFCRYAIDLPTMLKVMSGRESQQVDWDIELDSNLRVHFLTDEVTTPWATPVQPEIRRGILAAVDHLRNAFKARIIAPVDIKEKLKNIQYGAEMWVASVIHDDSHSYCSDLVNGNGKLDPNAELVKFFTGRSKHTLRGILLGMQEKQGMPEADRKHFLQLRSQLQENMMEMLGDDGVLVFPTHPRTAPYHFTGYLIPENISYTAVISAMGLPSTHVPMGLDRHGLPFGIQIVSNRFRDSLSVAVAQELAKAFGGWRCA